MQIESIQEPWIKATIMSPDEYLGGILKLCQDRRGVQTGLTYVGSRAMVEYELPLNEVVFDFYDRLKSVSKGYASFDYQSIGLKEGDLVKMSILVNGDPVDALSMLVHRNNAESRGRQMCERLKDLIPRHLFKIPVPSSYWRENNSPRNYSCHAKRRDCKMLWWRCLTQTKTFRQAEKG
jgi:GTP-binding protein LepA